MKPIFTDQQIADQLTRDGSFWYGDNGDMVIDYAFSSNLGYWWTQVTGEFALNSTQRIWVEKALDELSDMFGFTFNEVSQPANTQSSAPYDIIQFANVAGTGTFSSSWSYSSGPNAGGIVYNAVVLDSTWASNQAANLSYGSYGYLTILHEILHSLGLEHPGEYNASQGGPAITYQSHAEFEQDTHRFTVMSYFNAVQDGSGAVHYDTQNNKFVYARTPMVYDILAMTSGSFNGGFGGYGFNSSTRNTDTTYGYNVTPGINDAYDFAAHGVPVLTIYDTGGTDTLDLSGDTVATQAVANYDAGGVYTHITEISRTTTLIDLREGGYSSTHGMTYNIGIAFGTQIENAIGTQFDDTIYGNSLNNKLEGGAGNDILFGGGGDDDLDAGSGNGLQYLRGEDGNDTYRYSKEDGLVLIDTRYEAANQGTADRLVFDDLNFGDVTASFYDDSDPGLGRTLVLSWNDGGNSGEIRIGLEGQTIETYQFADGSTYTADQFFTADFDGTDGADVIHGDDNANIIRGFAGNDRLYGRGGDDDLDAGSGQGWQYLYGEDGNDTYRYSKEDSRVFVDTRYEAADQGTADIFIFDDLNFEDITASYVNYTDPGIGNALRLLWNDGISSGEVSIGLEGQTIETYQFADGSTYTADQFFTADFDGTDGADVIHGDDNANIIRGLAGNDRLYGRGGDDDLDAGSGQGWQYLYGEDGNDTYRYSKEDSRVFVDTRYEAADQGTADIFIFDDLNFEDITASYVNYTDPGIGNALRLLWNDGISSGEVSIGLEGQTIETYQFADGSTYTADQFFTADFDGTDGADVIHGDDNANIIRGLAGNDRLYGRGGDDDLDAGSGQGWQYLYGEDGNDTYRYSKEDSRVFVDTRYEAADQGTADIFIFDDLNFEDITASYVNYTDPGIGNALRLLWNDGISSGEVSIGLEGQTIETYQFADGSTYTADQFFTADFDGTDGADVIHGDDNANIIRGLAGNDRLYGRGGDDDLDAGSGQGWQYLYGEDGNDTYRYSKEDSRVFVDTRYEAADQGTADIFIFDDLNFEDITASYVNYTDPGIGNALRLLWNDGISSGEVSIGLEGQTIETYQFADGSTYTADDFIV